MNTEIWKPIAGFEGSYEVSDLGRVRSLDRPVEMLSRWGNPVTKQLKGRVLKPGLDTNGYWFVFLGNGNIRRIHRLVADAFCESVAGKVVNHLNGVRTDATSGNLEATTASGNNLHAFRVLRRLPSHSKSVVLSKDGAGLWFPSIVQAARTLRFPYQSLYWALKNTGVYRGYEVAHG